MVKVEEHELVRRVQVLDPLDEVVLQAQEPKAWLRLENRDAWRLHIYSILFSVRNDYLLIS